LEIENTKLANGLHVVVAPDSAAPVVTVGNLLQDRVSPRPRGRSGFAHLFEPHDVSGLRKCPKMQHIKRLISSGGVLNGSTSYDVKELL